MVLEQTEIADMTDPHDIRVFTRDGRHGATNFNVTVWVAGDGRYFVNEVHVEGLPPRKERHEDRCDTLEEAFAAGFRIAREIIDG